jgi:Zn-dependent peptidase ImmA (M78 family)/DNA-binding XRE family transcriptional regulator
MTIEERLKAARQRMVWSQRDLAQAAGVSAMAISKYERGLDVPSSGVLLKLAQALHVKPEYFARPAPLAVTGPNFRRRDTLSQRSLRIILGEVQEWLERYMEVETLSDAHPPFRKPASASRQVSSLEDVEQVALALRSTWKLGTDAIENLTEVLEDHGVKVGLVAGEEDFDAVVFRLEDGAPVMAVKEGLPGDRQRFSLAHELGHLVIEPSDNVDPEKAAYRFAGAFLVPEPAARQELGKSRSALSVYELHLLKHKYGLSMQGWLHRAEGLGIIEGTTAKSMFAHFKEQGWQQREPGDQFPPEEPMRMERLVMRLLAENAISESRAAELLGMSLGKFGEKVSKQHDGIVIGVRG